MPITRNEISNPLDKRSAINEYTNEVIIDSEYGTPLPTNFRAVVLSGFESQDMNEFSKEIPTPDGDSELYYFVRVRPVNVQEFTIPSPFLPMPACEARNLILAHPIAFVKSSDIGGKPPVPGNVYECRFLNDKKQTGIRMIEEFGLSGKRPIVAEKGTGGAARRALYNGGSGTVGSKSPPPAPGEHIIVKLEAATPTTSGVIEGVGSLLAGQQAQVEIDWWKGKVEQHIDTGNSDENLRIKLYAAYVAWGITDPNDAKVKKAHIGGDYRKGTGGKSTGVMHWSATSISYVMRGTGFPKKYGHSYYSDAIARGLAPGWEIFSTLKSKIKPKVGDVFVKVGKHGRKSTKNSASHGDVVYKITAGKAHLAGGNLGAPGTFKEPRALPLDSNGVLKNPGPYLIVLKKMS